MLTQKQRNEKENENENENENIYLTYPRNAPNSECSFNYAARRQFYRLFLNKNTQQQANR